MDELKITEELTETSSWAAGATRPGVNLSREGLISELTIRANITATLTATAVQDCTTRGLSGVEVKGDKGKAYVDLKGTNNLGRLLALLNRCDTGVSGLHAEADVNAASFNQSYVMHFGSFPKDPFDLSAAIPARALSTLQIKVVCPAAAETDPAGLITAGTYTFGVNHVIEKSVPANLMVPAWEVLEWPHDADHSNYGKKIDIPVGGWLRRIVMLVQDETATVPVRKDDEITAVNISLEKTKQTILSGSWEGLKYQMARQYELAGAFAEKALGAIATTRPGFNGAMLLPAGFLIIDFRKYFNRTYGLNLMSNPLTGYTYQSGDVKMGLTVENYAAGDDTIILYDILQPVDPSYINR